MTLDAALRTLATLGVYVNPKDPDHDGNNALRKVSVSILKAVSDALAHEHVYHDESDDSGHPVEFTFTRYDGARAVAAVATLLETLPTIVDYVRRMSGLDAESGEVPR